MKLLAPLAALPQQDGFDSIIENPVVLIGVLLVLLFAFSFMLMLVTRYRRCPSNKILVIYGKVKTGESSRCLHGGGSFVWPLIQSYDYLDLEPIQIEVPLKGALSAENIRVNVPSYFTVAIGTTPTVMQNAAIRLLGLTTEQIKGQALDIIFGQLRQVIASMKIEEINRDRDVFLKKVQENLEPELEKIGLVLINVNITDITDESGYIEALGRKAASEAIQQAEIDVAEQNKKGAIGVAAADREREVEVAKATKLRELGTKEAERDMAVGVAQFQKERAIGEQKAQFEREAQVKEAEREMAVRVAELAKEKEIGERTAAFEREAQVKEAERAMRVQVAKANAEAVTGENQSRALVAQSEAELKVRQAESYAIGETKHRQAEAEVLAAQYKAEAIAAEANAKKVEAEQRAALEAPARAQRARIIVEAEAEAERVKIEAAARAAALTLQAEGEARATFLRLEAQARGEYEVLAKKAEGLTKLVTGCGGANQAFQLLMLEHLDHLAETSAKAISNIKFDKITVWDSGNGKGGAAGFLSSLGQSVPPLMNVMKSVGGVDMPEYLGKLSTDSDAPSAKPGPKDSK
ncbi:MAG: flotillin family protein [Planctomycetaceae bacterium]|nr:flotillin family protein [Planctomycetaceae bacterium]